MGSHVVPVAQYAPGRPARSFMAEVVTSVIGGMLRRSRWNTLRRFQSKKTGPTPLSRKATLAGTRPLLPKISDRELLSIICQLGRAATEATIRNAINERIGGEVGDEWVKGRIAEIEAAGLIASRQSPQGTSSIRLTALGVECLSGH
jgi:hypothetical protein